MLTKEEAQKFKSVLYSGLSAKELKTGIPTYIVDNLINCYTEREPSPEYEIEEGCIYKTTDNDFVCICYESEPNVFIGSPLFRVNTSFYSYDKKGRGTNGGGELDLSKKYKIVECE